MVNLHWRLVPWRIWDARLPSATGRAENAPEGQGRLVVGVGSGEPESGDGDAPDVPNPESVGVGDAPDVAPADGPAEWDGVGEWLGSSVWDGLGFGVGLDSDGVGLGDDVPAGWDTVATGGGRTRM